MSVEKEVKICDICRERKAQEICNICGKDLCSDCLHHRTIFETKFYNMTHKYNESHDFKLILCSRCEEKLKIRQGGAFHELLKKTLHESIPIFIKEVLHDSL